LSGREELAMVALGEVEATAVQWLGGLVGGESVLNSAKSGFKLPCQMSSKLDQNWLS